MQDSKGPIAETYIDLQGLPALEKALLSYPTTKCSEWELTKLILQALEIGIQNLNSLIERIIIDINSDNIAQGLLKIGWIKDINSLVIDICGVGNAINAQNRPNSSKNLPRTNSQLKLEALFIAFDDAIKCYLERQSANLHGILEVQTLNEDLYHFLHDYRIIAHEITLWNKNVSSYYIPSDTDYETFIGLEFITQAVNEPHLTLDTFFTQFRCLHQIPELFTAQVNDNVEAAMIALRDTNFTKVHQHLSVANELFTIPIHSFKPIIENLSHNEYHQFREYLGLTSGSHSVNIHFHLFRDLYPGISKQFVSTFFIDEKAYIDAISNNYILKLVETELIELHNSIDRWRDLHLNLPRIDLGENKTKSLIGSTEAVDAARNMQKKARADDPLNIVLKLYNYSSTSVSSDFLNYLKSEKSFDSILGSELGKITQTRFKEVQERAGVFSQPVKFEKPPKRML